MSVRSPIVHRAGVLLVWLAVVTGCAEAANPQRQPVAPDDGIQATGRLDGQRIAISDGEPEVTTGACGAAATGDDLCIVARTIDGAEVGLVVENPAVIGSASPVPVAADGCSGAACDGVRGRAVVGVSLDGRVRAATGGRLTPTPEAGPDASGRGYAAEFDLRLDGGDRLVGSFNVRPAGPRRASPAPS